MADEPKSNENKPNEDQKPQPQAEPQSQDVKKPEASGKLDTKHQKQGSPYRNPNAGHRGRPGGGRPQSGQTPAAGEAVPEFIEKIITIKRVTKVTKGGKKLSFSALAVVGNTNGKVGYSLGKGGEVAIAIKKALVRAKKNMITVPMRGTTITHEIIGECGGAEVMLKPASEGTGVIAAGPVRAVCDGAGIHNILTKCHRSNNPINVVKATIDGLSRLKLAKTKVEAPADAVA